MLRSWLPKVDTLSLTGRQILVGDLTCALRFLESQTSIFHTSRMKTVLLEKDQVKPTTYSDDGAFFVVTKLNSGGPEEGQKVVQHQIRDITTRQVFHEFDKLVPPAKGNKLSSAAGSTGISPAKARMQVAVA